MRISTRIWIAIVASAVATAVAVGIITDHYIEEAILPVALNHLQSESQRMLDRLGADILAVRGDVLAGCSATAVQMLMQAIQAADADNTTVWNERVKRSFGTQLSAKPSYLQICVISVEDGREIVALERHSHDTKVRIVPESELHDVSGREYYTQTIALNDSEVYVSDITANRAHGSESQELLPTVRVAAPIVSETGAKLGILLISLDMRPYLEQLRSSRTAGAQFYVVNGAGKYILHPEGLSGTAGEKNNFSTDFPAFAAINREEGVRLETFSKGTNERLATAMVTARLSSGPLVSIIETLPIGIVMAPARDARKTAFVVGGIAAIFGTFLAYWVGRSLSQPMNQLTRSLTSFHEQDPVDPPVNAAGEIGDAARAFAETAAQIREKSAELHKRVEELRRTEDELRSQIERAGHFGAALEHAHEAIFTMRLDGTITAWNTAAERLFGYTTSEMVGRNASLLFPEERVSELRHLAMRLSEGEPVDVFETVRLNKSGAPIPVSQTVAPVKSDQGEIIGAAVVMRSVAEERNAEAVRLALDATPNAMIMVDSRGRIVLVNAETERLFGYQRNELIGEPVETLVPTRFRFHHRELRGEYDKAPRIRRLFDLEPLPAMRKDGTEFSAEISLHPIMMHNGKHVLSVVRDVTERLESQRAIQRYTEELRRSNADLEQFAYIASHDLQEPLRMIASYTELLSERYSGRLDETADKYIHFAVDGAKRMKRLINSLLEYSRVDKQSLHLEPTDAKEVVNTVVTVLDPLIKEKMRKCVTMDCRRLMWIAIW